jgi:hypothetical protein
MSLPVSIESLEIAARESMFGLGNPGFCRECGAEREGVEPDADGYECYDCGAMKVAGAELLFMEEA